MRTDYQRHLIYIESSIKDALIELDKLGKDAILFATDADDTLIGALTDGDVRRGLIKGISLDQNIKSIMQSSPRFIRKGENDVNKIVEFRNEYFKIIPILDDKDRVINVINFSEVKSYLPVDVVIMAGGRGERLKPLTDSIPKPLLKVGEKPILEHNVDRLRLFGINDFWITLRYLGEKIENYFNNIDENNNINFVYENEPLGTIGAVAQIRNFGHDYVLVTNSDLLTNIDYEHFFLDFIEKDADFSVVTIPYSVEIPYAVLETDEGKIINFREKPTYTYYSNGGIYLMKKDVLSRIPVSEHFNATDLMENLIRFNKNVVSYPLTGYWLDIGRHEDYEKAQRDIKSINFL